MIEDNMNNNYYYDINCFDDIEESKKEVLESIFPFLKNEFTNQQKDFSDNNIFSFIQILDKEDNHIAVPIRLNRKNNIINKRKYRMNDDQNYCLISIQPTSEGEPLLSFIYTGDNHILITRETKEVLKDQLDCTLWNGLGDYYKNRPSKTIKKIINRLE